MRRSLGVCAMVMMVSAAQAQAVFAETVNMTATQANDVITTLQQIDRLERLVKIRGEEQKTALDLAASTREHLAYNFNQLRGVVNLTVERHNKRVAELGGAAGEVKPGTPEYETLRKEDIEAREHMLYPVNIWKISGEELKLDVNPITFLMLARLMPILTEAAAPSKE